MIRPEVTLYRVPMRSIFAIKTIIGPSRPISHRKSETLGSRGVAQAPKTIRIAAEYAPR
jgi:hypothetical protein